MSASVARREPALYLDASALVKLVARETETQALAAFLAESDAVATSCAIVRTEVLQAARGQGRERGARAVVSQLRLVEVDHPLLDLAARVEPGTLSPLDALHLAAALTIRSRLAAFVAYDRRLAEAAAGYGLPVTAPG